MNSLRHLLAVIGLLSLVLVGACSMEGSEPGTLKKKYQTELRERVTQRWRALQAKDYAAAYEFNTPNYRRTYPKTLYVNKFSYDVDWELTAVNVINYDADAAVASVAVRVMSKPAKQTSTASVALGATPVTLREKWIFTEGEWWHIPKL